MKYSTLTLVSTLFISGIAAAKSVDELKKEAEKINKAGSIAAKYSEVSKGKVADSEVIEKFKHLGPQITEAAVKWSHDSELAGAPPAFRRFLLFDYITNNTNIIAGASNPDEILINSDASVDVIFEDKNISKWAYSQMHQDLVTSNYTEINGKLIGVFPMMPSEASKAQSCISCHASAEVGRPYPEGTKILGYTFVALPK